MTQTKPLTEEEKQHWAYLQGRTAGTEGKRSERGWMAFGLSCAATSLDAYNTRLWLAGFDAGEREKAAQLAAPASNNTINWGRKDRTYADGDGYA